MNNEDLYDMVHKLYDPGINREIQILNGQMRSALLSYRSALIHKKEGAAKRTADYIDGVLEDGMYHNRAKKKEPVIHKDK